MYTIGQVINVDEKTNIATVAVVRQSACGENCAMCKGCSLTTNTCDVYNEINAKCGDKVKIEIESKKVLKAAFLVYALPLIIFAVTFCLTLAFSNNTTLSTLVGIITFFLSFILIFLIDKKTNKVQSKAVKILN